tara:strand:- start:1275 stop:1853 length:579 start_codon:yes stop_codon:yes gene_type:complete
MRGLLFKELLSFADSHLGEACVDALLSDLPLSSGGAYTSVGDYPDEELSLLIDALSEQMALPPDVLQRQFGIWLFNASVTNSADFFARCYTSFDVFEAAEPAIRTEIRKLDTGADFPMFQTERCGNRHMICIYRSNCDLADLCEGLIDACMEHFRETADMIRRDVRTRCETIAIFSLSLKTGTTKVHAHDRL